MLWKNRLINATCVVWLAVFSIGSAREYAKYNQQPALSLEMVAADEKVVADLPRTPDEESPEVVDEPAPVVEPQPVVFDQLTAEAIVYPQSDASVVAVAKSEPQFERLTVVTNLPFDRALAMYVPPAGPSDEKKEESKPAVQTASLPPAKTTTLPSLTIDAPIARRPLKSEPRQPPKLASLPPTHRQSSSEVEWGSTPAQKYAFAEAYTLRTCPVAAKIPPPSAEEVARIMYKLSWVPFESWVTSYIDANCSQLAEIAQSYRHKGKRS